MIHLLYCLLVKFNSEQAKYVFKELVLWLIEHMVKLNFGNLLLKEKRRHLKKFIDAIIRYCIPMEFVW